MEMGVAQVTNAENKKSILYICDRKKCNQGECPNPECFHTTDPNHRRRGGGSPSIFVEDQDGNLWEKYQLEMQMKREKCCPTGQESADEWYREEFIGGQDE